MKYTRNVCNNGEKSVSTAFRRILLNLILSEKKTLGIFDQKS